MNIKIDDAIEHLKKLGFNIDLDYKIWKDALNYFCDKDDLNGLVHYISDLQNCGGYALDIPVCIFPANNYTFEEKVLRIMNLYPFVRLLSNEPLKENEYIIKYRANNDGHHFIKIDSSGQITEKNGSNLPNSFENWDSLEAAPEAVFAVIKQEYRTPDIKKLPQCNANIFLNQDPYEYEENSYIKINYKEATPPMTFEKELEKAYKNKNSTFKYNNNEFCLKVDKNDPDIIYICNEKNILGTLCLDDENFIIELDEEKKHMVYGFIPNQMSYKVDTYKSDKNAEEHI